VLARTTRPHPLADERGLTLAEILVAMVILAIGLVGLASVMPISSYGLQEGNQMTTATFLAEQRLEQVKAAKWTTTPDEDCLGTSGITSASWAFTSGTSPSVVGKCDVNGDGTAAENNSYPDETPVTSPAGYGRYTRYVRIRPCDAGGSDCGVSDASMRMITVRVYYTPLQGIGGVSTSQKFVELTTLAAKR
jgi:type IV pilus assembly protein PilV